MALQHLRSSTANKRPLPAGMSDGQLAINTNLASPGLFLKNSNGDLVKVGPVHVGTTAPNASPAAGGETGNTTGELWLDTSLTPNELKTWNGSAWVSATGQEIPVSKLIDGSARQLLQTDAAGTGVEWTSNVDVPGTLDVTSTATFDSIASHPLGSAGAPTITFTGDTNTGIYSPGADQLALSTNGTQRLLIDASGNISAGGGFSGAGGLNVSGGGWGVLPYVANSLVIDSTAGQTRLFATGTDASTHGNLLFFTGTTNGTASERMRLTSTGLGIGTSSPGANLHVQSSGATEVRCVSSGDNALFSVQNSGGVPWILTQRSDTSNAFSLRYAGNNYVNVDTAGRVGIGTTSPSNILHIAEQNPIIRLQANSGSYQGRNSIGQFDNIFYIEVDNDNVIANSALSFYIDSTERARIDSSGRLLVGTSSSSSNARVVLQGSTANTSGEAIIRFARGEATPADGASTGAIIFTDSTHGDGALINGARDGGTWSASSKPSRLVFSVTADGASSPTEAMRIKNSRILNFANTPVYADNAAAKTGGLVDGDVYRKSDGTLMIVYT